MYSTTTDLEEASIVCDCFFVEDELGGSRMHASVGLRRQRRWTEESRWRHCPATSNAVAEGAPTVRFLWSLPTIACRVLYHTTPW